MAAKAKRKQHHTNGPKRVALYARVSTDEQRERQTINAQLHTLREHATQQEWQVVEEYLDEAVSGATPLGERPAGQRLLEAAADPSLRAFDVVIVAALDRLGRDAVETLLAERRLKSLGLDVRYVRESFDDSPSGDFQKTVMSAVAQLERALIAQRMSEGRKRSVRDKGKYLASLPPFGYDRVEGVLVVNEEQTAVVREMFRLCVEEDLGLQAIAHRLDEMEVPPPLKKGHPKRRGKYGWNFGTVSKMLRAERYIGRGSYGGVPMTCPAIVDEGMFTAAQAAMRRRQSAALRTRSKRRYWLTGHLRCRQCGAKYVGFTSKQSRSGNRVPLYECHTARRVGVAKTGHAPRTWRVRADEVEAQVEATLRKLLSDPERVAAEIEAVVEDALAAADRADDRVSYADARLADLDEQQQRVTTGWTRGLLDDRQADEERRRVARERREAEAILANARTTHESTDGYRRIAETFKAVRASLPAGAKIGLPWVPPCSLDDWVAALTALGVTIWVEADGALTVEGVVESVNVSTTIR